MLGKNSSDIAAKRMHKHTQCYIHESEIHVTHKKERKQEKEGGGGE